MTELLNSIEVLKETSRALELRQRQNTGIRLESHLSIADICAMIDKQEVNSYVKEDTVIDNQLKNTAILDINGRKQDIFRNIDFVAQKNSIKSLIDNIGRIKNHIIRLTIWFDEFILSINNSSATIERRY